MLVRALARLEAWLRLDGRRPAVMLARGRAIYVLAGVFILSQLINLVAMTVDYGRWTSDHSVSLGCMAFAAGTIVALRYCKIFVAYSLAYTAAMIVGIILASIQAGINSALLPALVWAPLACGMISGWRSVVLATTGAMAITFWLYGVSMSQGPGAEFATGREFQRLVQTNLALLVSGSMAAVFSYGLRHALISLEAAAIRAREAEAAKSDFLAQISHELRTPLNGVLGLTDALATGQLGERERALTETIRGSGQSLLAILNDLLDLSKIEAGKLSVEPAPFAPAPLVHSVAETWREGAARRGTGLRVEMGQNMPAWLLGDALRIRQVLDNFVSNAVKFTENGEICLRLDAEPAEGGSSLVFRVSDTGRGIPPNQQAAVFERFEQGMSGTARTHGGTGLGLAICRQLARLMDGSVSLESSGPTGTVFAFRLILPRTDAPVGTVGVATKDVTGLRVLVAEDNAVNRMVAAEFLKRIGVEAVFAENGQAALDAIRLGGFDVVLMDKHMPLMDGVEATRAVRALPGPERSVPIIAVTADAMVGERDALLAEGMDGYLSKPLKLEPLRAALAEAVAGANRGTERPSRSTGAV